MKSLWRATLVAALIASALLYPLEFTLVSQSGSFGFSTDYVVANAPGITRHLVGVTPGSPAWRAGLRPGDALPLTGVDRNSRVALNYVLPGAAARFDVQRGKQTHTVHIAAVSSAPYALTMPDLIRTIVIYCVLFFALLVVLRAWNTEYGPLIATILAATAFDAAADRIPWVPATANLAGAALLGNNAGIDAICTALTMFLPIVLAGRLTRWSSPYLQFVAYAIALYGAFIVVYCPIGLALYHTGTAGASTEFANDWLLNTLPFFACALGLLVAYRTAQGESRQRLRWVFWGFFPYNFGVGLVNAGFDWQSILWVASANQVAYSIFRAMELALPVSLFYGVLLRRVVDIGFVFNRVAVYGILSILLVAAFVVLEYAVSRVLLQTGRTDSLLIQLGVALAIGLSARYLHRFVERLVDRVLFAKRHADESALRHFAHEAEVYSAATPLLDRSVEVLLEHTDARGVGVYLADEKCARVIRTTNTDFPASVDIDDPLLVKLRRWNEPVDTHDVQTVFPDGMVFPMCARGRVIGALACGAKRDYSAFDPDERASILEVARGVGAALDALASDDRDSLRTLGDTLAAAIAEGVAVLSEKIDRITTDASRA